MKHVPQRRSVASFWKAAFRSGFLALLMFSAYIPTCHAAGASSTNEPARPLRSPAESLRYAGVDGRTVWRADHLPLMITDRYTGQVAYEIELTGVDLQIVNLSLGKPQDVGIQGGFFDSYWVLIPRPHAAPDAVSGLHEFSFSAPAAKTYTAVDLDAERLGTLYALRRAQRAVDTAARTVVARIPTVTSGNLWDNYDVDLGYLTDAAGYFRASQPYAPGEALATYLMIDRFYDNKIVNASLAVLSLARTMSQQPILPGGTYSYLASSGIRKLIESGQTLIGKGTVEDKEAEKASGKDAKIWKLDAMPAGGVCASVTAIAKMARRAEADRYVRITDRTPHAKEYQYYFNPADPVSQVDATAYDPGTDFQFVNLTSRPLYIAPHIQIIPDTWTPARYNGYNDSTAFFVMSFTLRTTPVTEDEIRRIQETLASFRSLRGI